MLPRNSFFPQDTCVSFRETCTVVRKTERLSEANLGANLTLARSLIDYPRNETPWHSIHGHGWSRHGHQWIQFVGGHRKFHRWPWMVHHWPSMEFRKIFRTKIRSKCESSKCTLVNAKFELASHCVIEN